MRRPLAALLLLALVSTLAVAAAPAAEWPPQAGRGIVLPAGFAARPFTNLPPGQLPTSLAWGPAVGAATASAAADEARHGSSLYVTTVSGNFFSGTGNGSIVAYSDEGVPTVVAQGLDQPLGIAIGPGGTLYLSENADNRGRVTALRDADGNGTFEAKRTVIRNLPNGRHQTNGLAFGPDGMLYVANGNATDDGIECGPALTPGAGEDDCPAEEMQPWSGSILRIDPNWTDVDLLADIRMDADLVRSPDGLDDDSVLVAHGFRNIYDLDFDPLAPTNIWTPMNGSDNPSSSDPLYRVDAAATRVVGTAPDGSSIVGPVIPDAGFPSCLYDPHDNPFPLPAPKAHDHPGALEPQDNPNPRVQAAFGTCDVGRVLRPEAVFEEGHEGTSGAAFVRGPNFPERYRGDLFVAEWGSLWNLNGGTVTGHKVIHVDLDENRKVIGQREFMSGVLPMDLTFGPNGHLWMADMSGQIWHVWHLAEATQDVVTVDMRSGQFVPPIVSIVRGQTVRWVNADATAHTVQAVNRVALVDPAGADPVLQSGKEMNSPGPIAPGASHQYRFTEAGVYHYNSRTTGLEESTMRGSIIVLPADR